MNSEVAGVPLKRIIPKRLILGIGILVLIAEFAGVGRLILLQKLQDNGKTVVAEVTDVDGKYVKLSFELNHHIYYIRSIVEGRDRIERKKINILVSRQNPSLYSINLAASRRNCFTLIVAGFLLFLFDIYLSGLNCWISRKRVLKSSYLSP